ESFGAGNSSSRASIHTRMHGYLSSRVSMESWCPTTADEPPKHFGQRSKRCLELGAKPEIEFRSSSMADFAGVPTSSRPSHLARRLSESAVHFCGDSVPSDKPASIGSWKSCKENSSSLWATAE